MSENDLRVEKNRRRLGRNLGLILCAAVIFLLVTRITTPDRPFSDTENRPLKQFPTVSASGILDGSLLHDLEHWFSDQFFARDQWITGHLELLKSGGFQDCGDVFLGKEGFLFLKPETPDREVVNATVEAMNALAEAHPELNTTAIIVPDAAAVLKDLAPEHMPVRDQTQDIGAMESLLSESITRVDAGAVLSEHPEEYIYYATDHHWTSLGAYYTFAAAAEALDVEISAFDVFPVTDSFEGTLASRSGSHLRKDSIDIYLPKQDVDYFLTKGEENLRSCSIYSSDALEAKDKYTVFFGGNYGKIHIQTTVYNGRRLLVFKDSYANCFIQFLIPCYEEIIIVDPRYYYGSMDELLRQEITDVLYLYSGDTILTTGTLKDVLSSGQSDRE